MRAVLKASQVVRSFQSPHKLQCIIRSFPQILGTPNCFSIPLFVAQYANQRLTDMSNCL